MRLRTVFKGAGLLVIAVAVAAVAALLATDPNEYKPDIAEAIEAETGRKVALDGNITWSLGLVTGLSVADVRLANAPWGSRPDMLRVGQAYARVALLPLLGGSIAIRELQLRDAEILIEIDRGGRSNLEMTPAAGPDSASPSDGLVLDVGEVEIRNASISLHDGRDGSESSVRLDRLDARAPSAGAAIDLAGDGSARLDGQSLGFSLRGRLADTASLWRGGIPGRLEIDEAMLSVDGNDLAARGRIDFTGPRPRVTGVISGELIDLDEALRGGDSDRIFSDDPLPFAALSAVDGEVKLEIGELIVPDFAFRDLVATARLENGALTLAPVSARLGDGTLGGSLTVSRGPTPQVALRLSSDDFDIAPVVTAIFGEDYVHGDGAVDIALDGTGSSLAGIIGAGNGHVRFLVDDGRIRTGGLGFLVGGISEVLKGGSGLRDWTAINCVAGDFAVRAGIAESRLSLIDTKALRLVGRGKIDLGKETVDFGIVPSPKTPTLNLALPVNVRGPLSNPSVTPDELSVLKKLGGLVGSIVFPPAAILSLGELGKAGNPCLEIVEKGAAPADTRFGSDSSQAGSEPNSPIEVEAQTTPEKSDTLTDGIRDLLRQRQRQDNSTGNGKLGAE